LEIFLFTLLLVVTTYIKRAIVIDHESLFFYSRITKHTGASFFPDPKIFGR